MKKFVAVGFLVLSASAYAGLMDQQIGAVNQAAIQQETADQMQAAIQAEEDARARAKAEARADRQDARREQMEDLNVEERRTQVLYGKGVLRREDDIINSQIRRNDAEGRERNPNVIIY